MRGFTRHRLAFTLYELMILIGIIALLLAVVLTTLNKSRSSSGRIRCASNLRQIGQGFMLYANDNKGVYPRTRYAEGSPITAFTGTGAANPFASDGPAPNDVTAALFLLVRDADLNPDVFVCEGTWQKADPLGGYPAKSRSNFAGQQHLSYSFANPYPSKAAEDLGYQLNGKVGAEFVTAADRNDADQENLLRITSSSPASEQKKINSSNHGREGQYVLFNDGHVEWATSPWVGAKNDNIYTAQKRKMAPSSQSTTAPAMLGESGGVGPDPQGELDTVLLPAKGIGW